MATTFKEQFYSLCDMLGENRKSLTSKFGISPDISEDEHRAFICYPDIRTVFRVADDQVKSISIPAQDAYGHQYTGPIDFYVMDDVHLGMSKEEIIAKWGEPDGRKYMNYESKVSTSGKPFTIGLEFKRGEDTLVSFHAKPYSAPTFEKSFLELCELLGCNENTIIDEIGKPDTIKTNEYGTKFIFYDKFKAIFTIGSDLHTASYVPSPCSGIEGSALNTNDSYYTFQGIRVGDTRNAVQNKWGNPTSQATYNWTFGRKAGNTKSKNQYEIRLSFSMTNPDVVSEFEAGLKEEEVQYSQPVSEKPKSGCFIATACYGDYDSPEVLVLRHYRDNVLLNSVFGQMAVKLYYFISPPLAKLIENSATVKNVIL